MCIFLYIQILMFIITLLCIHTKKQTKNLIFLMTSLLWGIIFGLRRDNVGNDSTMYSMFYRGYSIEGLGTYEINSETEEYGFTLVANLLHRISPEVVFFYLAVSVAVYGLIYFVYKNKSTGYWGYLCFFLMSAAFATLIIAMRQSMSIAFILLGLFLLKHVKYNGIKDLHRIIKDKYFLLGICAFLFSISVHRSTIILLPILVLAYFVRYTRKAAFINILVVFVFTVLLSSQIGDLFNLVLSIVGGFSDDNVSLLAERYSGNLGESSMTLFKIASWCVPLAFTVKYSRENVLRSFEFSCLMIAFTLYIMFGSATMCIRISMLFQIIGFSVFVPEVVNTKPAVRKMYIVFTLSFFYSAYKTYSNWLVYPYDSTLPFYFFWE